VEPVMPAGPWPAAINWLRRLFKAAAGHNTFAAFDGFTMQMPKLLVTRMPPGMLLAACPGGTGLPLKSRISSPNGSANVLAGPLERVKIL
jgi:hypothetical protein